MARSERQLDGFAPAASGLRSEATREDVASKGAKPARAERAPASRVHTCYMGRLAAPAETVIDLGEIVVLSARERPPEHDDGPLGMRGGRLLMFVGLLSAVGVVGVT